jgi:hypothetical protein
MNRKLMLLAGVIAALAALAAGAGGPRGRRPDRVRRLVKNATTRSSGPRARRRILTPGGSSPSVAANPEGAPISATLPLASIPSLRTSGVPE